eukprot:CAMPEP_0178421356 /NCGR_PEP_ID=MMETSP0689_2-20121128/26604_1 /TAXON_ID=160604 /ORGANISM="Amphidinium massartii, Strain CS-259" /LENGTH=161 /DNA_ID=CAMNT_0020042863 /DNA_START=72 /DNA_END=557 /DNA_ORIENTATION=+
MTAAAILPKSLAPNLRLILQAMCTRRSFSIAVGLATPLLLCKILGVQSKLLQLAFARRSPATVVEQASDSETGSQGDSAHTAETMMAAVSMPSADEAKPDQLRARRARHSRYTAPAESRESLRAACETPRGKLVSEGVDLKALLGEITAESADPASNLVGA